jgi:protein SCO1
MKYALAVVALGLVAAAASAPVATLPGDSLYQLKVELAAQDGRRMPLAKLRGRPVLIAMFYSSCEGVCPIIAFTMRKMEAALTPEERSALRPVMVSFDPERDTAKALTEFARLNKLEDPRWIVARTPEASVLELAAALGVRYRQLPGGTFSHSTIIAVLDADGVIRARTSTLTELDGDFMRTLSATIAAGERP